MVDFAEVVIRCHQMAWGPQIANITDNLFVLMALKDLQFEIVIWLKQLEDYDDDWIIHNPIKSKILN